MTAVIRLFVLVVCCGTALAWISPLAKAAPPPQDGESAFGDREFIPRAGYLRTVRLLQIRRQLVAAGAAAATLNTRPISGIRQLPVVLVEFSNVPGPFPPIGYQELMFGFGPDPSNPAAMRPTMRQYYQDVSHGKFDVQGQVFNWVHLPNNDAFYEDNQNGGGLPFGQLLKAGLEQADAQTDLGQFDNDGADGIANSGDDDGIVDTVLFIHPEAGAELQNEFPSTAKNIWSHSWHYSEPTYGHGVPFETKDVRRQSDGTPALKPDGTPAHILVEDYTIQPGLARPNNPGAAPEISTIGVICHEYGHALGLPDLYDRTPSRPNSEGVGNWCLMAGGSYGADGEHSELPAHMSAWCKQYLGWANVQPITATTTLVLEPFEAAGKVFRFDVPGTSGREYFLIEYRKKDWSSPGHVNWDQTVPQSGLAIWHVDELVGDGPTWPFADHDQGQNDSPSKPGSSKHSLVALEQADQKLELENATNRGDGTDLWTTGDSFQNITNGGSQSYAGQPTGFGISAINLVADSALANLAAASAAPPVAAAGPSPGAPIAAAGRLTAPLARSRSAERAAVRLRADLIATDDQQQKDIQLVEAVQEELDSKSGGSLSAETKKQLSAIPESTLRRTVVPAHREQILDIAAEERKSHLSATSAGQNPAERAVIATLKNASYSAPVDVQVSSSREFVDRITNLDIPTTKPTLIADAQAKLSGPLEPLFEQISLDVAKQQPSTQSVAFQQSVEREGETLPVFNSSVTLHYGQEGRRLQAVTANNLVKTADLHVTGKSTITKADAAQVLENYLGSNVPEDAAENCRKGVYLISGEPDKARVAYRTCLPVGETQEPIHVYIDAETSQVLGVE